MGVTDLRRIHKGLSFSSSLPEGTLCYSEGEVQHFCQDSLCLPLDPALTTRGLLEEGEYSPRDLLILDNQGHVLSKADPFHSKADKTPLEVEENVLVDS